MKPMNFPERKRQRRLRALERLAENTYAGVPNKIEIYVLMRRTGTNLRDARSKKDRTSTGRFRAA